MSISATVAELLDQACGSVAPGSAQVEQHLALLGERQTFCRQGRARHVSREAFQSIALST